MKKILKRLLISTALITPIAVSAPLLLTSCSIEETTSEPSIFGPLSEIIKPSVESADETSYFFSTSPADAVKDASNNIIKELKKLTPGPSFEDQAKAIATKLFDNLEFEKNPGNEESNSTDSYSWKNKNPLKKEHFEKLDEITKDLTLYNIVSLNETPTTNISFKSSFFKLSELAKLTDKIDTTVQIDVGIGSNPSNKDAIETKISIDMSPKNDYKWNGLNTNHPIEINVEFFQDEKATLFNGGLEKLPKYDTTKSAFIFNADLNKNVFGDHVNKITGTNKIKQWFELPPSGNLVSGGENTNSITGSSLQSANTMVASKINEIFSNLTKITYETEQNSNNVSETITDLANKITSKYIDGANNSSAKQTIFATNDANQNDNTLGKPNIKAIVSKIAKAQPSSSAGKETAKAENKKYEITLDFTLLNNEGSWFGFESIAANKNGKIQFILTVDLA